MECFMTSRDDEQRSMFLPAHSIIQIWIQQADCSKQTLSDISNRHQRWQRYLQIYRMQLLTVPQLPARLSSPWKIWDTSFPTIQYQMVKPWIVFCKRPPGKERVNATRKSVYAYERRLNMNWTLSADSVSPVIF